jgi:Family of unknown function (DUF5681)
MPPDDQRDYKVGYRKPPSHTRFVKGQSGNPRGRAPGAKNMKTLLTKALNELVVVTDNGGRRKVSKREAIITQLVNRSAKADFKAILDLLRKSGEFPVSNEELDETATTVYEGI